MALPPFKKSKSAKPKESTRDPVPNRISGSRKMNRNSGVSRDPFTQTATNTTSRMARQVRGK